MKTTSLVTLVFLVFAGSCPAALDWEQKQVDLHPRLGDTTAVAVFKYKNSGNAPVRFLSVHPSCGGTTASLKKDVVAPGEAGEITSTLKLGSNPGLEQKTVEVQTDNPETPAATLTLRAFVIQPLEIRPSFVYWENNEPPKPKTISVKAAKELNTATLKVSSSTTDFGTKVTSTGPHEFKIEVQPHDTNHGANATLKIEPENGGKPIYATARVVNPAAAE